MPGSPRLARCGAGGTRVGLSDAWLRITFVKPTQARRAGTPACFFSCRREATLSTPGLPS